ncbi:NADH dehydrogenase ubiquinone 1 alpha subcomplex subunit 2 [Hondaea fermentalgiana]|uniref:NADH dehydrogenase ubiquinone 1 alpha subcomplex subunit 2 n=1 Tax=Hondaea fermentalgiana TaxID=2315210 RepID=A0A2R5GAG4_9STRA|nr:NADH dehydrogenase ubiquinone 1 alpha subcomplex subunit 2 [Hondaea fermentalgiana]|eukprot:GBG24684.1 NADH dehydrogenase ubiquinone 1 alpha subcomplex subunit 2 [Hondaea fermentalgiana]
MSLASKVAAHAKELRFVFCTSSEGSKGLREFVKSSYVPLKKENPKFPLLVRECEGAQPRVMARFAKGKEEAISVEGMSAKEVEGVVEKLIS